MKSKKTLMPIIGIVLCLASLVVFGGIVDKEMKLETQSTPRKVVAADYSVQNAVTHSAGRVIAEARHDALPLRTAQSVSRDNHTFPSLTDVDSRSRGVSHKRVETTLLLTDYASGAQNRSSNGSALVAGGSMNAGFVSPKFIAESTPFQGASDNEVNKTGLTNDPPIAFVGPIAPEPPAPIGGGLITLLFFAALYGLKKR